MATTGPVRAEAPAFVSPELGNRAAQNKFQYLFFDLSRGFLSALTSPTCDCAAIAAKILVIALPILCFLEAIVDLLAVPFIWTANLLCRGSAPQPVRLEPAILGASPPIPLPPLPFSPPSRPLSAQQGPQEPIVAPVPIQTSPLRPPILPVQIPNLPPTILPQPVQEVAQQQAPEPVAQANPPVAPAAPIEAAAPPAVEVREIPRPGKPEKTYPQLLLDKIPQFGKNGAHAIWSSITLVPKTFANSSIQQLKRFGNYVGSRSPFTKAAIPEAPIETPPA